MPPVTIIYSIPREGRLNAKRLGALLGEAIKAQPDIEALLACQAPLDDHAAEAVGTLAQQYSSFRVLDIQPSTSAGAMLNQAVEEAGAERIIIVDGRAYLKPGAVALLLQEAADASADSLVYTLSQQGKRGAPPTPSRDAGALDHLFLRMRRPSHPVFAVWTKSLHVKLGGLDTALQHYAVADFMLRAAVLSRLVMMDSALEAVVTLTDASMLAPDQEKTTYKQQLLDEENRVVDRAFTAFLDGRMDDSAFSIPRLARELKTRSEATSAMINALQNGRQCAVEDFAHAFFCHGLLAMRLAQLDTARTIMETAQLVASERRDITRLYKLLLLRYPMDDAPQPDDITRIEQPPSGPKIVVATPLFNQGKYLREAVGSVINQTYPNWEMVIVDDGSTDDSYEQARALLAELDDPRLTLISQENSGLGATRNRAIKASDGSYVVCLDSDDMIAPDYFAIALDMLHTNQHAGWVNVKTLVFGGSHHVAWGEDFDFIQCIIASASACTSMIRREALEGVGYFREDLTAREDWEVWLCLLDHGWTYVTTRVPLFFYRHAIQRPGMKPLSNIPSKEEIISLHPWWYRFELDEQTRLKAYMEFNTVRFSPWFLNTDNIQRVLPVLGDREAFLKVMEQIKSEYPPITKPKRWQNAADDCYITTRKKKYGIT